MNLVFNPDDETLAVGSADGTIRLCDSRTGEIITTLSGHEKEVRGQAFDETGRFLASASSDQTLRLWDLSRSSDQAVLALVGHTEQVHGATFHEGRLVSGSADGTVRYWILDVADPAGRICRRANRNLTLEEWSKYIGPHVDHAKTCTKLPLGS